MKKKFAKPGAVGASLPPVAKEKQKKEEPARIVPLVLVYGWCSHWSTWIALVTSLTGDQTFKKLYKEYSEVGKNDQKPRYVSSMTFEQNKLALRDYYKKINAKKEKIRNQVLNLAKKYNVFIYDYSSRYMYQADQQNVEIELASDIALKMIEPIWQKPYKILKDEMKLDMSDYKGPSKLLSDSLTEELKSSSLSDCKRPSQLVAEEVKKEIPEEITNEIDIELKGPYLMDFLTKTSVKPISKIEGKLEKASPTALQDEVLDKKLKLPSPKDSIKANGARSTKPVIFDAPNSKTIPLSGVSPKIVGMDFKDFLRDNGLQGKDFNVVAHSMGGLVVREAIEFLDVTVNKFVILGTPNQGTTLASSFWARLLCESAVDYMKPGSDELKELNMPKNVVTLRANVNKGILIIGTRSEGVVLPYTSVEIPGSNIRPVYYQNLTHDTLPHSSSVHGRIRDFLYMTDRLFKEAK